LELDGQNKGVYEVLKGALENTKTFHHSFIQQVSVGTKYLLCILSGVLHLSMNKANLFLPCLSLDSLQGKVDRQ
jgi:hypothetical protein